MQLQSCQTHSKVTSAALCVFLKRGLSVFLCWIFIPKRQKSNVSRRQTRLLGRRGSSSLNSRRKSSESVRLQWNCRKNWNLQEKTNWWVLNTELESSPFSHAAENVYRNGKLLDWTYHLEVLSAWNGLTPLSQQLVFNFFRASLKEMPLGKLQNVLNAQ